MKSYYRGIKTNNLKNIDLVLPHNNIILIEGVSGSGKSSLAIDTIHNISLNELNQLMNIKDILFDYSIKQYANILPSVALEQENYNLNPRSSIATYFGLDIYFRNLFSISNNVSSSIFLLNRNDNVCKQCRGTGNELRLDPKKIIDYESTIEKVPFLNWRNSYSDFFKQLLILYCIDNNIDIRKKLSELNDYSLNLLLYSQGEKAYKIGFKAGGRKRVKTCVYTGPFNDKANYSLIGKARYFSEKACSACYGYRFSKKVLTYKLYKKNLGELYLSEIKELNDWILSTKHSWEIKKEEAPSFKSILSLLESFLELNLGYLSLNRSIPTLSGGELQRLRLAKATNSQFKGILYILDEPSAGLHPSETANISAHIAKLRQNNNTIILIENNNVFRSIVDRTITLGPDGGKNGGYLLNEYPKLSKNDRVPYQFFQASGSITITNESCNNIFNISLAIPMKTFVAICGASGSGKTSFLSGILPKYLKNYFYLTQKPLCGNSYSIIATYLGIFEEIKTAFASTSGVEPGYFSFHHSSEGRCKTCNGLGIIRDQSFYDISANIICPTCNGKRFCKKALTYLFQKNNIYQLLTLTVDELVELLKNKHGFSKTMKYLSIMSKVGLGYLSLFRNISSLSGGEAQRIKLCHALSVSSPDTIYLLDEPMRGVDENNSYKIIHLIYDIIRRGGSVFLSDHNLLPIKYSSYLLEFGPGGGKFGGKVLYNGQTNRIHLEKRSIIKNYMFKSKTGGMINGKRLGARGSMCAK